MKSLLPAFLSAFLLIGASLFAQNPPKGSPPAAQQPSAPSAVGELIPVTDKEAAWAAKERKTYPLDVCAYSGAKLGSMGTPPEYIFRAAGKPDRLVVFCCSGCEDNFMKEPAKHLAKIDAAAAKSGKK